jgi:hypothetical protein
MRIYFILFAAGLFCFNSLQAQDINQQQSKSDLRKAKRAMPPEKGDIFVIAVPTIGFNPAYGFMYGVGGTTSFFAGDPATTGISSGLISLNFTTKNQTIFMARSTVFTENNKWILNGDWRYLNSSLPTYGLGTGPSSAKLTSTGIEYDDNLFSEPIPGAQDMDYRLFRFYETASREVKDHFYLGLGYHLDIFKDINDKLLDTLAVPPVLTSNYVYSQYYGLSNTEYTLSGISLNASYDTRDNQNNSYKGQYANVSFRINPEFLGSDIKSTMLWLEYRKYIDLTKNHYNMLCYWGFANLVTSGVVPYMDLPAIGEDQYGKSGRGYAQGRFRGESLIYSEVEYRKHLFSSKKNPDFLGMVVFLNALTASNKYADISLLKYINLGAGAGLRLMITKNARSNLGIDYAWGNYGSSGFYVRLNETF